MKVNHEIKKTERKDRIDTLGGFGKKRTQVVPSKKSYTRKDKHKSVVDKA